ncbi:MAG: glycosyltransferase family 2 protein [Gammaproteobacteria bacterium]|nr:glycosyltransferase family 2 protein [Gammaproteobacteria bacterium]
MSERPNNGAPRVSIGLAVYNGENYLREAIASFLEQTYGDFELILSDNASTDATGDICREYAARDGRIRYVRQPRNMGAAWNQSEVMRLARGEHFKLAAHDDLCRPEFLERCVAALDAHPECVLAYTDTYEMPGGDTSFLIHWRDKDGLDTSLPTPSERFGELIRGDQYGYRIYGLIRTTALRRTALFGAYHAADHVLVAHLGLLGRFRHIPEKLFLSRLHPGQSIHLSFEPRRYAEWWGAHSRTGLMFPTWRYLKELLVVVLSTPLPPAERARCLVHLARWMRKKRRLLAVELFKLKPQTPSWDDPH